MFSDQVIILYMPSQVLDGMGVEQNGNMVDENEVAKENPREKTEIVYEAAGPDEVEVIEVKLELMSANNSQFFLKSF